MPPTIVHCRISMKPLDTRAFDYDLLKQYLPNLQRVSVYVLFRKILFWTNEDGKTDQ